MTLHKLIGVGVVALAVAIGAITRVDLALRRLGERAIRALLDQGAGGRAHDARVDVEAQGEVRDDSDVAAPGGGVDAPRHGADGLVGGTRAQVREVAGRLTWSDASRDFMKGGDGVLREYRYVDGRVVEVRVVGSDADHRFDRVSAAPIGISWDDLIATWGRPDHCEAGSWYYASRDGVVGVRVDFSQGRVVGSSSLPWEWMAPAQDLE